MTRSSHCDSESVAAAAVDVVVVVVAAVDDTVAADDSAFAVVGDACACSGVDWRENLAVVLIHCDLVVSKEAAVVSFGSAAMAAGKRTGGSLGSSLSASSRTAATLDGSLRTRMGCDY